MIYNKQAYELGSKRSAIRELFEYGKQRAAIVGAENVYDFSLGNPTVPAPDCVDETIRRLRRNWTVSNYTVTLLHREMLKQEQRLQIF